MPTLETTVNGIKLPNPFVIGSGPPGTNANVCGKAFDEGWGAVIIKTISLDSSKVVNVAPRYARLRTASKEVPPRAKKSSLTPTRSRWSNSCQRAQSCCSVSLRGPM